MPNELATEATATYGARPSPIACRCVPASQFKDKPASEQWSRMPYENDTGVVWRRGRMMTGRELAGLETVQPQEAAVAIDLWWVGHRVKGAVQQQGQHNL